MTSIDNVLAMVAVSMAAILLALIIRFNRKNPGYWLFAPTRKELMDFLDFPLKLELKPDRLTLEPNDAQKKQEDTAS